MSQAPLHSRHSRNSSSRQSRETRPYLAEVFLVKEPLSGGTNSGSFSSSRACVSRNYDSLSLSLSLHLSLTYISIFLGKKPFSPFSLSRLHPYYYRDQTSFQPAARRQLLRQEPASRRHGGSRAGGPDSAAASKSCTVGRTV